MARQLRVVFPGALYHLTSRGNERQPIYRTDADRVDCLDLIGSTIERYSWICHGYVLMGNHYHLLIETPRPNLPEGMQRINGCYAQSRNRRWARVGHLFQGRYHAVLVEKEAYLLELVRYIALNPVRSGWCDLPEEWRWSSYRAQLGLTVPPTWLTTDWVLGQFGRGRAQARDRLREFAVAGIATPTELRVRSDLYLGSDEFIARHGGNLEPIAEVPRAQWQPLRPPLETIFAECTNPLREAREHGYTFREIGEITGRHYSTMSRRLSRLEREAA